MIASDAMIYVYCILQFILYLLMYFDWFHVCKDVYGRQYNLQLQLRKRRILSLIYHGSHIHIYKCPTCCQKTEWKKYAHTTWPFWCQPHLLLVISRVRSNTINWWHNFRKKKMKIITSKLCLTMYQHFSLHCMAKVRPAAGKYSRVNNIWYHHLYSFRS
jgi:hypothetical protein